MHASVDGCRKAFLLALVAGGSAVAAPLRAQGPPLSGIVTDTLGIALELAEVVIRPAEGNGGARTVRAGAGGRFSSGGLGTGRYVVTVRRIGYFPLTVQLDLAREKPQWVQFELVPRAQQLPELQVSAERPVGPAPLLRGTVVDEQRRPIEQAEIVVTGFTRRGAAAVRSTDVRGQFIFPELQRGRYAVTVRRVGYAPIQVSLSLTSDSARRVQFVMVGWPQELPEIIVERRNTLARGIRRARAYDGIFLTRDDIVRAAPKRLGDALRRHLPNVSPYQFALPNRGLHFGVALPEPPAEPRTSTGLSVPFRRRLDAVQERTDFLGADCPPAISLNGAPVTLGYAINDIDPQLIEAVEIYRRRDRRRPVDFDIDLVLERSCGALVVLWLRAQ